MASSTKVSEKCNQILVGQISDRLDRGRELGELRFEPTWISDVGQVDFRVFKYCMAQFTGLITSQ